MHSSHYNVEYTHTHTHTHTPNVTRFGRAVQLTADCPVSKYSRKSHDGMTVPKHLTPTFMVPCIIIYSMK